MACAESNMKMIKDCGCCSSPEWCVGLNACSQAVYSDPPPPEVPTDARVLEIAKYWSNKNFVIGAERFLLDFAHALQREQAEAGSGTR